MGIIHSLESQILGKDQFGSRVDVRSIQSHFLGLTCDFLGLGSQGLVELNDDAVHDVHGIFRRTQLWSSLLHHLVQVWLQVSFRRIVYLVYTKTLFHFWCLHSRLVWRLRHLSFQGWALTLFWRQFFVHDVLLFLSDLHFLKILLLKILLYYNSIWIISFLHFVINNDFWLIV